MLFEAVQSAWLDFVGLGLSKAVLKFIRLGMGEQIWKRGLDSIMGNALFGNGGLYVFFLEHIHIGNAFDIFNITIYQHLSLLPRWSLFRIQTIRQVQLSHGDLIHVQKTFSPSSTIRGIPLPINPDVGRMHHLQRRGGIDVAQGLPRRQDYSLPVTVCSAARLEDHLVLLQTRLILDDLIV